MCNYFSCAIVRDSMSSSGGRILFSSTNSHSDIIRWGGFLDDPGYIVRAECLPPFDSVKIDQDYLPSWFKPEQFEYAIMALAKQVDMTVKKANADLIARTEAAREALAKLRKARAAESIQLRKERNAVTDPIYAAHGIACQIIDEEFRREYAQARNEDERMACHLKRIDAITEADEKRREAVMPALHKFNHAIDDLYAESYFPIMDAEILVNELEDQIDWSCIASIPGYIDKR